MDDAKAALEINTMNASPTSTIISPRSRCVIMLLGIGILSSEVAMGQQADEAREQRLAFMKRTLGELQLSFQGEPDKTLKLTESPVLRFSNPVRSSSSDGGVFVWLSGRRPIAAATIWIRNNQGYGHDFTSLSAKPLQCTHDGKVKWSPRSGNLINQTLEDAPRPARTTSQRLSQMRKLADRFSAEIGAWPEEGWTTLRLMPRPIYRYASEEDGVIDGAIFALAVANDPEVLVQLEATRDSVEGAAKWSYSIARMSAIGMKVSLDDKIVWEAEGYWRGPRSPNDPYMENFGSTNKLSTFKSTE